MFNISEYLKRVSKKLDSNIQTKEILSEIIKEQTNISIDQEKIEIKNYTAYIKTNQAVLNKIFINKNRIIEEFSKRIPEEKIVDIK